MDRMRRLTVGSQITALIAAVIMVACGGGGGDDGGSPTGPPDGGSGDISAVVGSWRADSIVVQPKANPQVSREIVSADGVVFTLNVQSSGSYRATLTAFGQSSEETGTVRVQGNRILFTVRTPIPGASEGTFSREGSLLIMLGDLVLDFNQDGTLDDLDTRFVMSP
jgi:hypothetical protein